jgi:hypothetical protein
MNVLLFANEELLDGVPNASRGRAEEILQQLPAVLGVAR